MNKNLIFLISLSLLGLSGAYAAQKSHGLTPEQKEDICGICRENLSSVSFGSYFNCRHILHAKCFAEFKQEWEEAGRSVLCPFCQAHVKTLIEIPARVLSLVQAAEKHVQLAAEAVRMIDEEISSMKREYTDPIELLIQEKKYALDAAQRAGELFFLLTQSANTLLRNLEQERQETEIEEDLKMLESSHLARIEQACKDAEFAKDCALFPMRFKRMQAAAAGGDEEEEMPLALQFS